MFHLFRVLRCSNHYQSRFVLDLLQCNAKLYNLWCPRHHLGLLYLYWVQKASYNHLRQIELGFHLKGMDSSHRDQDPKLDCQALWNVHKVLYSSKQVLLDQISLGKPLWQARHEAFLSCHVNEAIFHWHYHRMSQVATSNIKRHSDHQLTLLDTIRYISGREHGDQVRYAQLHGALFHLAKSRLRGLRVNQHKCKCYGYQQPILVNDHHIFFVITQFVIKFL